VQQTLCCLHDWRLRRLKQTAKSEALNYALEESVAQKNRLAKKPFYMNGAGALKAKRLMEKWQTCPITKI